VLHQASGPDAPGRLARRAEAAASALSAAGVTLVPLDGPSTAASLAGALDPERDPRPAGLDGPSLYDATVPVTLARRGDLA
jgi:hypothetical protein